MKTFLRVLLFLFILITGVTAVAVYWTFLRPLPDYNAQLDQEGIHRPVDIHWDSDGIPHIFARNKRDAYFALGYVHAQDRLWQMTLSQMAAEGRFAEFLGPEMVQYDILQRTIGFRRIARRLEQTLSDSTRSYLQAYADGVNAYAGQNPKGLPIQFSLVDMEPIPWTVTHSIALSRLMAWELNMAWKSELTYGVMAESLTAEQFDELLPESRSFSEMNSGYGKTEEYAAVLTDFLERNENLQALLGYDGSYGGSNAWAVDGSRSVNNLPILAGDPHLALDIPGKWYEVHLNIDGRNLSGATIPGNPFVVLGQNDHLAWSMTNLMLDDTDFFREAVNPGNPGQFVLDTLAGEPLYDDFEIQREVIRIKNSDDTVFTRRLTNHGPVISDVYTEPELTEERLITMRWTGQDISNEAEALLGMNWAQSMDEFRESGRTFKVPGQNFIYADREGNIARFSLARIPVRTGNPVRLRDGWDSSQDWQGFVPFEELPSEINPGRGWVGNANNPPTDIDYPHYLSIYWEPGSRYDRMRQYLNEFDRFSTSIFQQMQLDSYSLYSREITEVILPVLRQSDREDIRTVTSYLENWGFSYSISETAASIMDVFLLKLSENTFRDEMPDAVYRNFIRFPSMPARTIRRFLHEGSSFFDDVTTTDRVETRDEIILQSMEDAVNYLTGKYGEEPFEWRWEQLHTLTLRPPLFGRAAEEEGAPNALKLVVNNLMSKGPHAVPGNAMTLNKAQYRWNSPYHMIAGPSIRRIIDFSDLSKTLSILPTGQSGNPLSRFYGDQTESWLNGQYKYLYQDSTFFSENQFNTMKFIPVK